MEENKIKVIKHTMSVEYECPKTHVKHSVKIEDPIIYDYAYFSEYGYKYIEIKCKTCGELHKYIL
jgi:hypothetical protein